MRAEKGFIMIGDETDGTVIPQDLNLDWAVSKKRRILLVKERMNVYVCKIQTEKLWFDYLLRIVYRKYQMEHML